MVVKTAEEEVDKPWSGQVGLGHPLLLTGLRGWT